MKMDYKKLGMFLITGMATSFIMSIVFKDTTLTEISARLFLVELVEIIVWCFTEQEK
jgi:hypothetical protein